MAMRGSFDLVTEYPRWRLARDRPERREHRGHATCHGGVRPRAGRHRRSQRGPSIALLPPVRSSQRTYSNKYYVWVETDLKDVITAASTDASVADEDAAKLAKEPDLDAAIAKAKELSKTLKESPSLLGRRWSADSRAPPRSTGITSALVLQSRRSSATRSPRAYRSSSYFSNYSVLPGETDLTELARKIEAGEGLDEQEQTVVSLLAHAGVKPTSFLDTNYDSRKAELQAAAVDLSREVFKYWRANTDLEVVFGDDNVPVVEAPSTATSEPSLPQDRATGWAAQRRNGTPYRSSSSSGSSRFFAAFSEYLHTDKPGGPAGRARD